MVSKKIVVSMVLSIATSSLYGMLTYPGLLAVMPYKSELFKALYAYDAEKIKKLIMDGADVNEKDDRNIPFLWQMIDKRNHFSESEMSEIVDLLIEKGVNLNFTVGHNQATVLHQVAAYGVAPLLKKLIKAGADVHAKNAYDQTAYDRAKSEEIKTMLRSDLTISPVLVSQKQKQEEQVYQGLHVVLRCYPGPVKQLEGKKDLLSLTFKDTK